MRAKERLTGAIILVVLIVLVVPELLTGPREAHAPATSSPEQSAPLRSYTIELGDRNASRPGQPRASDAAAPESGPSRRSEPARVTETQVASPEPAPPPAQSTARSALQPATSQVRKSAPAPAAVAARPITSGWSVQVGSFANRDNAQRLTSELRRLGFRSFVTEGMSGGRKLYRVRVGPEADRAATQALAERLRAAGHAGAIVPHP